MSQTVLVTGGAGYIGGTVCSALEDAGHRPIVLDTLTGGSLDMVGNRPFYRGDIGDPDLLAEIFSDHPDLRCTIHCAALAIVPDSVERPLEYYSNNVTGSIDLFRNLASMDVAESYSARQRPSMTQHSARRSLSHPPQANEPIRTDKDDG